MKKRTKKIGVKGYDMSVNSKIQCSIRTDMIKNERWRYK